MASKNTAEQLITETSDLSKVLSKRIFSALSYTFLVAVFNQDTGKFRRIVVTPGENMFTEADHALLLKDKGFCQRRDARMISDTQMYGAQPLPGQLFVQNKDFRLLGHVSQTLRNPDLTEEKRALEEAARKTGG